jgi:hypothetical protein
MFESVFLFSEPIYGVYPMHIKGKSVCYLVHIYVGNPDLKAGAIEPNAVASYLINDSSPGPVYTLGPIPPIYCFPPCSVNNDATFNDQSKICTM